MTSHDLTAELRDLDSTLRTVESVLDLDALAKEKTELESIAAEPGLWDTPDKAQKVTSRLSYVQGELNRVTGLRHRLEDAEVLLELAADESDEGTLSEARQEIANLRKLVDELEVRTLLSGPYDEREALVTVRSGAGGADASDFAEQLMRMYLRWAERHKYPTEVYDVSYAEEAGIKSATFAIKAPYIYGTLSVEQGTHRMVRISKYDNQGRRQTAFAAVEVVPVVETTDQIEVPDDEIRVDVYRASGPGGQGVNTTDSAVRITHLPTGLVASCQNERSQLQNKASAMAVLMAKLLQRKRAEEEAEINELRGDVTASWGDQMRTYVQHPYQMVKDLRTGWETNQPDSVLDGDIDGLIEAGIRWRKQRETAEAAEAGTKD
ncbi:peptide chain release factor 2 [Phytomonospora endophytica]|uniref:Peptide chain release factor 2 n=1 Tax=Phytomonospora endophytica TaxID=714109 RepID=A0A841G6F9_9ACTN|nr:peptide chain release factor 2 [Phytomonospora endophytica]MBB6039660.1 peptide chain release factor 2 [Phytomonospora endophytica]GIG65621.1 peptide chain release factor 2 [Phytomonospora endophytica]